MAMNLDIRYTIDAKIGGSEHEEKERDDQNISSERLGPSSMFIVL